MVKNRVQRYKLTAEFILKDRGDYESYRDSLLGLLHSLDSHRYKLDYASLEKVEDQK